MTPEIPAGHGRPRFPGCGEPFHFSWLGEFFESPGALHGGPDAKISGGQNVRAAQSEHEEHLRGPYADSFHLRQVFDDGGIIRFRQGFKNNRTSVCMFSQFPDIQVLAADRPSLRMRSGRNFMMAVGVKYSTPAAAWRRPKMTLATRPLSC